MGNADLEEENSRIQVTGGSGEAFGFCEWQEI